MNLRVLIVDDEPLARQRLRRLLRSEADIDVLAECGDGRAALLAIEEHRPDLIFLDVQMPEMSGFDVLAAVGPTQMPAVIFVTAYDRFALQAFEAQALDYLLKPFGEERVRKALERARKFLTGDTQRSLQDQMAGLLRATAAARGAPCVLVRRRGRVLVLRPNEIDWIEAYGDYVRLHVRHEVHLIRGTLTDMEQRLGSQGFVRIHRSRLVNWDRVREFALDGERESVVVLKDGARLNASQTCLKDLQQRLDSIS
ncbi:MAG: yehT 1 [Gammaproteobacteria bacterium]|jgi:two-component system LytT family response regulator|nr:yehT 1 [Gammaproteobacteria bacterium]